MKIIDHNGDKTVGIVGEVDGLVHIGAFRLDLLTQWIEAMNAQFEVDNPKLIHLFKKVADDGISYALFASADGNDPMVAVGGHVPEKGKWDKVYPGQVMEYARK